MVNDIITRKRIAKYYRSSALRTLCKVEGVSSIYELDCWLGMQSLSAGLMKHELNLFEANRKTIFSLFWSLISEHKIGRETKIHSFQYCITMALYMWQLFKDIPQFNTSLYFIY